LPVSQIPVDTPSIDAFVRQAGDVEACPMAFVSTSHSVQDHAWPVFSEPDHVSILAGNSRLDVTPDGSIKIEAQMQAFKAALVHADAIRRHTGALPPVSIAFDHKGVFRRQFLRAGLSNSQQRNPRLCHLRTEIINTFAPAADALHIPLEHILVIHEDSARTHAEHVLDTAAIPAELRHRMAAQTEGATCATPGSTRITCAAITSEYFCKAVDAVAAPAQTVLEVFFEPSPWSEVLAYVRGLQLTHALGMAFGIRLNLVTPEGSVRQGEIVHGAAATSLQFVT
jgi:hypothetical protein